MVSSEEAVPNPPAETRSMRNIDPVKVPTPKRLRNSEQKKISGEIAFTMAKSKKAPVCSLISLDKNQTLSSEYLISDVILSKMAEREITHCLRTLAVT